MIAGSDARAQRVTDIRALARSVAIDYVERALMAEREGRPIAAEGLFARAVEADRSYLSGYLGLARVMVVRGRSVEASRVLNAASLQAVSDDDDAARWARAMLSVGALEDAVRAIEARAESARSQLLLAELFAASGRFPEALARARRALDLSPDDPAFEREARRLVRALSILVGEADVVRAPGAAASTIRRWLAR